MSQIPIDDQIAEVNREIGMRRAVYSRSVQMGKMTRTEMEYKINVMRAVVESLEKVKGKIENQTSLF